MTSTAPRGPRRAAVLGMPIEHSLSPVLHRAAYRALGLTQWRYDAVRCDEDSFPGFLADLGPEWAGLSVTMPLKRVALAIADERSDLAVAVGAANTVLLGPTGRRAENTDVTGIVEALREAGLTTVGSALILGAGGTGQAALAALREIGHLSPTVLVRDVTRATDLREAADRLGVTPHVVGGLEPDQRLPDADLVISTLPPGAADALHVAGRAEGLVVLDVSYATWPTPFAVSAGRSGAHTVSGLSLLLHQAVSQVELMTGLAAPVPVMRAALEAVATVPDVKR